MSWKIRLYNFTCKVIKFKKLKYLLIFNGKENVLNNINPYKMIKNQPNLT